MTPNADSGGRFAMAHAVDAVAWTGGDPWPVCLWCAKRVYLADRWLHFDTALNASAAGSDDAR